MESVQISVFVSYNGDHNGCCLAYIGDTSNLDTNLYVHHCIVFGLVFVIQCTTEVVCYLCYLCDPYIKTEILALLREPKYAEYLESTSDY